MSGEVDHDPRKNFLRDILENPEDDTPRLVFVDWLEERGDPRAGVVQDRPEVFGFIAGLATAENIPSDQINQFVDAGEVDLLATMVSFLKLSLRFVRNRQQSWIPSGPCGSSLTPWPSRLAR